MLRCCIDHIFRKEIYSSRYSIRISFATVPFLISYPFSSPLHLLLHNNRKMISIQLKLGLLRCVLAQNASIASKTSILLIKKSLSLDQKSLSETKTSGLLGEKS